MPKMIVYNKPLLCLVFFVFSATCILAVYGHNIIQLRNSHKASTLSTAQTVRLADLTDTSHMNELLDNILVPRVVGTKSHEGVFFYIKDELTRQGFSVEVDEFTDETPTFGTLKFRNIIGTLNPDAERFLVIACHYDGKYFEDFEFIAAVDSGVPCAMMLNLAKVMKGELQPSTGDNSLSLKLIFFDGEEAFNEWGPFDSLYGARNLANTWHKFISNTKSGQTVSKLHRIDVFVLLDLIGSLDPEFPNYFKNTERWYNVLADAEKKLFQSGLLVRKSNIANVYFTRRMAHSTIQDDHIPFLEKGVPILHLIPTPFPKVWHKESDNRDNIDMDTIENLNKILRVFVAQYLNVFQFTPQNLSDTNTTHNEL